MPQGTVHQSKKTTKLLNIGESGAGKTGALKCFLLAGFRLIIADFDNGIDILINLIRDDKDLSPEKKIEVLNNLYYETFTDPLKMQAGKVIPVGTPSAFTNMEEGLGRWRFPIAPGSSEYYDLGNMSTWGPDTIFVLDSLGLSGIAALRFVRQQNMHQMEKFISQPDYGQAMLMVEVLLQLLYASNVKCHVIVNSHITYQEDPMRKILRGLPRALGSKLPPNVGGYFNSIVRTVSEGSGKSIKRIIRTISEVGIELKLPIGPGVLPDELPIEDGLLTIFKKLQEAEWLDDETPVVSSPEGATG